MNTIILLAVTGIFSMFSGIFRQKQLALPAILIAFILALGMLTFGWIGNYDDILNNMLIFDNLAINFSLVIIFISIFIFIMSQYYYSDDIEHLTDLFALFVFSIIGGILLVSFQNLTMLFLGTEILSIPLYILAASNRRNLASNEAGLKYYLMGSFATCFLLLGITLIYGAYGSFDLTDIHTALATQGISSLFLTGVVLILCSFIFKLSAVPFHFWAPDVYHGAPTVLTAFVSTVVKVAVMGALLRFMAFIGNYNSEKWVILFMLVSVATMIFGTIVSIKQKNFKRLLAYSGMANVGFVLIAILTAGEGSSGYILYNLTAYSIASILAFTIYSTIKSQTGIDTIKGISGLVTHNKLLATGLLVSMLSFAGIPPLAGFFGKYFIIFSAVKAGDTWLAVIAILTSVVAAYNYLRISAYVVNDNNSIPVLKITTRYRIFIILCIALIIGGGILPDQLFGLLH
ncbi:MAG: NADH-quinone oxidoreductase subunit N [Saprospiraceae bacterium]|jgi:NADH-quinone oxidoreductase subunit N|nr:NADH-quinone oxidoreductase subunit N [Saprospiraceae bacterium]